MLKILQLRKRKEEKQVELTALREKEEALEKREAELEEALEQVETEGDQKLVEEGIDQLEADREEAGDLSMQIKSIEDEISGIDEEIEGLESKANRTKETKKEERKEETKMNVLQFERRGISHRLFDALPYQQREMIVQREDAKAFLDQLRSCIKEKRAVSDADLTIPVVMLDLIRENIGRYSKLISHIRVANVPGEARVPVAGTVPEAVWTEMCANINELELFFNQWILGGFKLAGYIPVCNSILEDSDIALAAEVIEMLGQSLGMTLDKTVLYGTGEGMPMGVVTRLAQAAKPSGYPVKAPTWEDLHTTNILAIGSSTSKAFIGELIMAASAAKSTYSSGDKFWAMNDTTFAMLMSRSVEVNAAGTYVATSMGQMPIIGGAIETLNFMPDGDIIGGYGDLYLLAQRAGVTIDQSEHVQFLQDNTVFRARARYDGVPVRAEAFVGININGGTVTTSMPFAPDTANTTTP